MSQGRSVAVVKCDRIECSTSKMEQDLSVAVVEVHSRRSSGGCSMRGEMSRGHFVGERIVTAPQGGCHPMALSFKGWQRRGDPAKE
jgi:hypothetical protein